MDRHLRLQNAARKLKLVREGRVCASRKMSSRAL